MCLCGNIVGAITDTVSPQLADIANIWRRLDTHTGEWGIGRAERSAIDFSAKYTFLSAKEIPANALTCAFCSELKILTIEFCGRGKGSILPNLFLKRFSTYTSVFSNFS